MKFHFINVVWGKEYTQTFLDVSIPSQLSPGNLLAYRHQEAVYKIYTTPEDAQAIVKSKVYSLLVDVIKVQIKVFNVSGEFKKNIYELMTKCHQCAVIEANKENSIMIFLGPDSVWSDDSFGKLIEIAKMGKKVVMIAGCRATKETFIPDVKRQPYFKDTTASIPSRELVKLLIKHAHPVTQSLFWDAQSFSVYPSHLYWRVNSNGFLARCFHLHPLMILPDFKNVIPTNTIDAEYISSAIGNLDDIHIVNDSDEILGIEVSNQISHTAQIKNDNKSDIDYVYKWCESSTAYHHLSCFNQIIRFHSDNIDNLEWKKSEQEFDAVVFNNLRQNFSKLSINAGHNQVQNNKQQGYFLASQGNIEDAYKKFEIALMLQDKLGKLHEFDQLGIKIFSKSFTTAIGHMVMLDLYVKMEELGWSHPTKKILLAYPEDIANYCYLNYWNRYFNIISDPCLLECLAPIAQKFEEISGNVVLCQDQFMWFYEAEAKVQKQWEMEKRKPLLNLSEEHFEQGWKCLTKFGIPKGASFVCIHGREAGFWGNQQNHRNVNIETYLLAIKTIIASGAWVIRVGDKSMQPLPKMEKVFDYAHSDLKSEWMDVFLAAQCRFFLGCTSGLYLVSHTFGVPCICTNCVPFAGRPFSTQDLFLPKMIWSIKDNRYLTFEEAWKPPLGHCYNGDLYANIGTKLVDNTDDEINDIVIEMLSRINGTYRYNNEDEMLQNRYNSLAKTYGSYGVNSRIGRDFLRKYKHLLPEANM